MEDKRMASESQLRIFLAGRVAVEANGHVSTRRASRAAGSAALRVPGGRAREGCCRGTSSAEALWEDAPPATWDKALTVIASKLRACSRTAGSRGDTR